MTSDYINVTLPLTQQGLNVIVVAVFIAIVTGVIWLALSVSDNERPDPARRALEAFGWVYAPIWFFLFGGVIISIWWVFNGIPSPFSLAQGDGGAGLLGLGTLIAALLGAPFVIWGTVLKHQTVMFQKEGHMTDRINKAVEQLGAEKTVKKIVDGETQETSEPNIEVRIGAILSLERIAQDSTRHDKGRDHVRVMEILCAYIRQNSGVDSAIPKTHEHDIISYINACRNGETSFLKIFQKASQEMSNNEVDFDKLNADWLRKINNSIRIDVQLAINVIGRRSQKQIFIERPEVERPIKYQSSLIESAKNLVFSKSLDTLQAKLEIRRLWPTKGIVYCLDLKKVNFQGYSLKGLDFSYADMSNSIFDGANLEDTNLFFAELSFCGFNSVYLTKAQFAFANIAYTTFVSCIGYSVNFIGNSLHGCTFVGGNFHSSNFLGVSIYGSKFSNVNLAKVTLVCFGSDNLSIIFCRANATKLIGLDFDQFSELYIREDGPYIFGEGMLADSALKDVRFSEGTIVDADFSIAFGDRSVLFPKGMNYPDHWPDWKLPDDDSENGFVTQYRKWLANPATYKPPTKPEP